MSPPASTANQPRGIVVQKPKADIYTALLGIALAAILLAILCLCLELSRYDWERKATASQPGAPLAGENLPNPDSRLIG